MAQNLLLKSVRPMAGKPKDILISNGLITQIENQITSKESQLNLTNCEGLILYPGFVDAHTHLDKTLLGLPWHPHSAGPTIQDKVDNERQLLAKINLDPEKQSANQVRLSLSKGTTHIRSHVDINADISLSYLEGVLATRANFADLITMEIVAFPQQGMLNNPRVSELMEEAIKMGANLVGGIDPSTIERNPAKHLDTVFAIADRQGVGVDIHLHEPGELGAFSIELIAERTKALGLEGRVTISHAFCLGMVDRPRLDQLIEKLLASDIAIMSHAPGGFSFPPLLILREAGVRLCSGSDGIRDAWGPYGNADMLERAMLLGYRSNFRRDDELEAMLDIVTHGGADVMKLDGYGLEIGCNADLVLVEGETISETIMNRPPRTSVLKRGKIVAQDGVYLGTV